MKKELKDALGVLKALLFAEKEADKPEGNDAPEMAEFKAKDGTTYRAAKVEAGEVIEVANEAGEFAPAADGDIEAEDGSVITVKGGKIEAVKAAEAMAEDAKPEDAPAADAPTKEQIEALTMEIKVLNETLASIRNEVDAEKTKTEQKMQAMFQVMEAISNESEEQPSSKSRLQTFKKASSKDEATAKLKDAFNSI
jgi:hypothetical protein